MPAGAEGDGAGDFVREGEPQVNGGLIEQMVGPDVAHAALAVFDAFIANVFVCAEHLAEVTERAPLKLARLIDAGLGEGFLDQLARLLGLMVVVAGGVSRAWCWPTQRTA